MLLFNSYSALVLRSLSILTKDSIIIYRKTYHWNKGNKVDFTENIKNYNKDNLYSRSSLKQRKEDFDYLYGLSVVLPALEQKRRKFHRLFIQDGFFFRKKESRVIPEKIRSLANEANIPIVKTTKDELNKLLKDNKPHQGIILKASKLEPIKIVCLGKQSDKIYQVIKPFNSLMTLNMSSNGTQPFWLALDQVVDPQNLGAIIRSAYFFGVSGLVICSKNSAPLSAVTSKASSGALEIMDIYDVDNLTNFLNCSSQNNWIIYGAVSNFESRNNNSKSFISINELNDPLSKNPIILVIGSEGAGLRPNISNTCHHQLYISSPNTNKSEYIDSLNVNAATAVLLQEFLSRKG